jgi:long-chain acyl-CoA synthetase
MIYTSGTTGHPKGVRRLNFDAAGAVAMGDLAKQVFGVFPGCAVRTVVTGPLYHSAPNFFGSMRSGMAGLSFFNRGSMPRSCYI